MAVMLGYKKYDLTYGIPALKKAKEEEKRKIREEKERAREERERKARAESERRQWEKTLKEKGDRLVKERFVGKSDCSSNTAYKWDEKDSCLVLTFPSLSCDYDRFYIYKNGGETPAMKDIEKIKIFPLSTEIYVQGYRGNRIIRDYENGAVFVHSYDPFENSIYTWYNTENGERICVYAKKSPENNGTYTLKRIIPPDYYGGCSSARITLETATITETNLDILKDPNTPGVNWEKPKQ